MPEFRPDTCDEEARAAALRQTVYALLAGAFSAPPSAESFAAWRDLLSQHAVSEFIGDAAAKALLLAAESAGRSEDSTRDAQQEFMNLWKIPGGQYLTPYESVYRDTRDVEGRLVSGLLMGQSAIDAQKWYRLAAVKISGSYRELPDHIGLEVGYLAHLCGKEQQFAAAGDSARLARARQMQRDFLAAHVASWIESLRDRLYEVSKDAYFRALADLAVDFIRRDLAKLERAIGPSLRSSAPPYASAPGGR